MRTAMLPPEELSVRYGWLVFVGFAVVYTWIALWLPLGGDFPPPVFSSQNTTPREKIVLVHSLFLAAYLGLMWLLFLRESSFDWLIRRSTRHPTALQMVFVAILTGVIERLWLYRGPKQSVSENESDPTDEN